MELIDSHRYCTQAGTHAVSLAVVIYILHLGMIDASNTILHPTTGRYSFFLWTNISNISCLISSLFSVVDLISIWILTMLFLNLFLITFFITMRMSST